jgi:hypothetical protein
MGREFSMFNVTVDIERGCFESTIFGFWTLDTISDFHRAVTEAGRRIQATGRAPISLCDYTGAMTGCLRNSSPARGRWRRRRR